MTVLMWPTKCDKLLRDNPLTRLTAWLVIGLALLLVACAPPAPTDAGSAATVEAITSTGLPPDHTPPPTAALPTPTPLPASPGELSISELKYRLLAEFPDIFFCDRDFYPLPLGDEMELALQRFAELQANPEEFDAILAHNDLAGLGKFSDEQKLLIYREHKQLAAIRFEPTASGYQFQLQVAKTGGGAKLSGERISGLIDSQGAITVQERKATIATCPICLAAGTLIDTPSGPLPVESLRPGTVVWTLDRAGVRVAQPLLRTGSTPVPDTHQVVHLVLDDGRQLWVSPGHPTADGRRVGQIQVGGALDGAAVLSAERVTYSGYATYDLLPAGETGFYWANGILIASTLGEDNNWTRKNAEGR